MFAYKNQVVARSHSPFVLEAKWQNKLRSYFLDCLTELLDNHHLSLVRLHAGQEFSEFSRALFAEKGNNVFRHRIIL